MRHFSVRLNNRGFTLTESMVVVALVALMVGFGYSEFSSWIRKERVRSAANHLAGHLREARIRSIEKHISHALLYPDNSDTYSLFTDPNHNLTFDPDEGEIEILSVDISSAYPGILAVPPYDTQQGVKFKTEFDVRGFPQLEGAILFLSEDANVDAASCLNGDCCRLNSCQNGPSCGDARCCAVCVSYGEIRVVCNDDPC